MNIYIYIYILTCFNLIYIESCFNLVFQYLTVAYDIDYLLYLLHDNYKISLSKKY